MTTTKGARKAFWTYRTSDDDMSCEVLRNGKSLGAFRSPVKGSARKFAIRIVRSLNTQKVQR